LISKNISKITIKIILINTKISLKTLDYQNLIFFFFFRKFIFFSYKNKGVKSTKVLEKPSMGTGGEDLWNMNGKLFDSLSNGTNIFKSNGN
jgi:hypothetical protein